MFQNWGFLVGEIIVLLILAALIGLLAGWLIWGRRETTIEGGGDAKQLVADLERCRSMHADKDDKIAGLEAELTSLKIAQEDAAEAPSASLASMAAPVLGADATVSAASDDDGAAADAAVEDTTSSTGDQDFDGDGVIEGEDEGVKPKTLDKAREGGADDLKMIKGIGPKLEKLCNRLGFYHFDQIAAWTTEEEAWVNANLEGFKGRVSRDTWVEQAKLLAKGGETEFSKKVGKGGVYD